MWEDPRESCEMWDFGKVAKCENSGIQIVYLRGLKILVFEMSYNIY